MLETKSVAYQEIPRNKLQSKVLTNWSKPDIWVLVTSFVCVIAAWVLLHPLVALIAATIVISLNFRSAKSYGRNYDEMKESIRGLYITGMLGGILWQAEDTSKGLARWLRRKGFFIGRGNVIPFSFAQVEAVIDEKVEKFSLLRQTDRPYDQLFIASEGGVFASLDVNQQQRAVDELATLTNQIIAQSDLKVGISYVRMTGPYDPSKIADHLRTNMNPIIAQLEKFALDPAKKAWAERMKVNANQLRPAATAAGAAKAWYLIVLTIKRGKEWKKAQKGKLSDKQLYELPLVELGRSMVETLQSSATLELTHVRCLGLAELAMVVRCSWDVTSIGEYYMQLASGAIPRTDEEINVLREKLVAEYGKERGEEYVGYALRAWPEKLIAVSRDEGYVRMDDNYIGTLRVTRLPERIRADQFLALHYLMPKGMWTRQAMVGQSVSGDSETKQLIFGESALINWNNASRGGRIVTDPRYLRRRRALSQQAQQVSASSVSQHFNMLLPIVASSPTEFKLNHKRVKAAFNARGFHAELVRPPARLLSAAISGMLGANRL